MCGGGLEVSAVSAKGVMGAPMSIAQVSPPVSPTSAAYFATLVQGTSPMPGADPVFPSSAKSGSAVGMSSDVDLTSSSIPFVDAVYDWWLGVTHQQHTLRHRMISRLESGAERPLSLRDLTALQYDVAAVTLQQEVVTLVAKKATDTVSTLIKNG